MELLKKSNGNISRSPEQIENMIDEASVHYGNFLKAVGFDFTADKQTENTPRRVAKAWLKENDFTLVNALLMPSILETTIQNSPISIETITEYPYENKFTYKILNPNKTKFKNNATKAKNVFFIIYLHFDSSNLIIFDKKIPQSKHKKSCFFRFSFLKENTDYVYLL